MNYYMNILNLILLLNLINIIFSSTKNYGLRLRNTGLRLYLLKQQKLPYIMSKIKFYYKICYEKSIVCIFEGINEYNNLSEEEKQLIDSVLSLCY